MSAVLAAQTDRKQPAPAASGHRVVVDLTTVLSDGWALTLGNIEGLKRSFNNSVEIEVVAHGPAVAMLHKTDTDFAERIRKLHDSGVRFVVGTSTLESSKTGRDDMMPLVEFVPSAATEIIVRQEQGWSYLKGGY